MTGNATFYLRKPAYGKHEPDVPDFCLSLFYQHSSHAALSASGDAAVARVSWRGHAGRRGRHRRHPVQQFPRRQYGRTVGACHYPARWRPAHQYRQLSHFAQACGGACQLGRVGNGFSFGGIRYLFL